MLPEAFCLHCKKKQTFAKEPKPRIVVGKSAILAGNCSVCKSGVGTIIATNRKQKGKGMDQGAEDPEAEMEKYDTLTLKYLQRMISHHLTLLRRWGSIFESIIFLTMRHTGRR